MKKTKKSTRIALAILAVVAIVVGSATALFADPPFGGGGDDAVGRRGGGPGRSGPVARLVQGHMELAQYYMLAQDYAQARDHYLWVATYQPPERPEGAVTGEDDSEVERPRARRGRRGERQRRGAHRGAARIQSRAYLMAAVASQLLGETDEAIEIAEAGLAQLPERPERPGRAGRRGPPEGTAEAEPTNPFERFLEDPAAFAERFAGGAAALEEHLLELETRLSENE
jgi:hypothetical protein